MKIYYGTLDNLKNVTGKCITLANYCNFEKNGFYLPASDGERANYFGDHLVGILKYVVLVHEDNMKVIPAGTETFIEMDNCEKLVLNNDMSPQEKLDVIHSNVVILYENFYFEYTEQLLSCEFIQPHNVVLEIGANVGRNAHVIAALLNNPSNLLTIESSSRIYGQLCANMQLNNSKFHSLEGVLSKIPLYEKDWNVHPTQIEGSLKVENYSYEEVKEKFNLTFDTVVADCEGSFTQIIEDFPEILEDVNTIIIENDFMNIQRKIDMDVLLMNANFSCTKSLSADVGNHPCRSFFYQVWYKPATARKFSL